MTTELLKRIIKIDQNAINRDNAQLDSNLKIINAFSDRIEYLAGRLTKQEYHKVVNQYNAIDFEALNEIAYNKALSEKPFLAGLAGEIGKDKVKEFGNIPEFVKEYIHNQDTPNTIPGLVQASLLNENPDYWTISKQGQAVLVSGIKEKIEESHKLYATSDVELKRLELCENIKKLTLELVDMAHTPANFDVYKSVLKIENDELVADPQIILVGNHPNPAPLFFNSSKVPEPMPMKETVSQHLKSKGYEAR